MSEVAIHGDSSGVWDSASADEAPHTARVRVAQPTADDLTAQVRHPFLVLPGERAILAGLRCISGGMTGSYGRATALTGW